MFLLSFSLLNCNVAMLIVTLLVGFVFYNYSLLIMPVTRQPGPFAPSEFQTGLYDCFKDCSTCKYSCHILFCDFDDSRLGNSVLSSFFLLFQYATVCFVSRALPVPLPMTWTSAACAGVTWPSVVYTGPSTILM